MTHSSVVGAPLVGALDENPETRIKMKYDPSFHHRRSIRLKGYDYSRAGLYFVTICTQENRCLFGEIENGERVLNDAGKMIEGAWKNLGCRFDSVRRNDFIVMPNHFHGVIEIIHLPDPSGEMSSGQTQGAALTVGDVVGTFKSMTTIEYIRNVKKMNWPRFEKRLWQRNYYEHIIRDENSYLEIAEYIRTNPLKWRDDRYYVP